MPLLRYPRQRRTLSFILVVLGGALLFLAPDDAWIGAALAALGVAIELIAFGLTHYTNDKK